MKKSVSLVIALLVVVDTSSAEEPAALQIKNKSSFTMGERNPFWPIGWKPSGVVTSADTEHSGTEIPPSAFMVSSITIEKGTRFAIINGKIIQEGQQFAMQMGTSTYQLTLKSIEDGRVVLGRRDQEIVVLLRRK